MTHKSFKFTEICTKCRGKKEDEADCGDHPRRFLWPANRDIQDIDLQADKRYSDLQMDGMFETFLRGRDPHQGSEEGVVNGLIPLVEDIMTSEKDTTGVKIKLLAGRYLLPLSSTAVKHGYRSSRLLMVPHNCKFELVLKNNNKKIGLCLKPHIIDDRAVYWTEGFTLETQDYNRSKLPGGCLATIQKTKESVEVRYLDGNRVAPIFWDDFKGPFDFETALEEIGGDWPTLVTLLKAYASKQGASPLGEKIGSWLRQSEVDQRNMTSLAGFLKGLAMDGSLEKKQEEQEGRKPGAESVKPRSVVDHAREILLAKTLLAESTEAKSMERKKTQLVFVGLVKKLLAVM